MSKSTSLVPFRAMLPVTSVFLIVIIFLYEFLALPHFYDGSMVNAAQIVSTIPMRVGYYIELPKLPAPTREQNFSFELSAPNTIRVNVSRVACNFNNCPFTLTAPDGSVVESASTSGGYPRGNALSATYVLPVAGKYGLVVRYEQGSELTKNHLYYSMSLNTASATTPPISLMSGADMDVLPIVKDTVIAFSDASTPYLMDGNTLQVYDGFGVQGREPALSPSGYTFATSQRIAFSVLDGKSIGQAVYITPVTYAGDNRPARSQNFRMISGATAREVFSERAAWSPDGGTIAFQSNRAGGFAIYTVRLPNGEPQLFSAAGQPDSKTEIGGPHYAPDGKLFAYHARLSGNDANYNIYRVSLDGKDKIKLTNMPGNHYRPVWSPDGSKIAFLSTRDEAGRYTNGGQYTQVYIMNADGTEVRRITQNTLDNYGVDWSPDGRWLAYVSGGKDDHPAAFITNVETGKTHKLLSPIALSLGAIQRGETKGKPIAPWNISWRKLDASKARQERIASTQPTATPLPSPTPGAVATAIALNPTQQAALRTLTPGITQKPANNTTVLDLLLCPSRTNFNGSRPIYFEFGWYSKTTQQMQDFLENAIVEFTIDGKPIRRDWVNFATPLQTTKNGVAILWYIPITGQKAGRHTAQYRITFKRPISDGTAFYGPTTQNTERVVSCTFRVF